jgi:hypothetical protein
VPIGALLGGHLAATAGSWWTIAAGATGLATATLWVALSPIPCLHTIDDVHG